MRLIGHLETEDAARTIGDFLYVQGIENQVESDPGHGWALWINSEDELDPAREWLAKFRANPAAEQFKSERSRAAKLRQARAQDEAQYSKKVKDRRAVFRARGFRSYAPVTVTLIIISAVVFFLEDFGRHPDRVLPLFITSYTNAGLPEVLQGQLWRLFTPMFIHFDVLHIFFNLLWLRDLGAMIESRQGALRLVLLVLTISLLSNFAQFVVSGPVFGGMSGVVFGLVGYIWMRGRFDPGSGLLLHPWTIGMVLIWGALCLVGVIPHVANTVHVTGLLVGMAWGYLTSLRYR